MTLEQAITIASAANRWRRSETDEPMPNPKDLGVAIDTLVAFASTWAKRTDNDN